MLRAGTLALEDFFLDYGRQDRARGEILTRITVPRLGRDEHFRCYKISKRFDQDISALLGAFRFRIRRGRITEARIAYGGMATTPKRAPATERAVTGLRLRDPASWSAAAQVLSEDFTPIDDHRASALYRMRVARSLLLKALAEIAGRPTSRDPDHRLSRGEGPRMRAPPGSRPSREASRQREPDRFDRIGTGIRTRPGASAMSPSDRSQRARDRAAIAFSNFGHCCTHMYTVLYATAVLYLPQVFDLPYGELLSLSSLGLLLYGVAALPAGWLGDRWSQVGMMVIFFLGIGAGAIVTGLADGPKMIFAGLTLIGLFAAIYHPVGIAWIVASARKQGMSLGINGVFGNAGNSVAPVFVGVMIDYFSWAGRLRDSGRRRGAGGGCTVRRVAARLGRGCQDRPGAATGEGAG